jgi:hypothetical protein
MKDMRVEKLIFTIGHQIEKIVPKLLVTLVPLIKGIVFLHQWWKLSYG